MSPTVVTCPTHYSVRDGPFHLHPGLGPSSFSITLFSLLDQMSLYFFSLGLSLPPCSSDTSFLAGTPPFPPPHNLGSFLPLILFLHTISLMSFQFIFCIAFAFHQAALSCGSVYLTALFLHILSLLPTPFFISFCPCSSLSPVFFLSP